MCRTLFVAVALIVLLPVGLLTAAQEEKGLTIKGQIKIGDHTVKLNAGKLYEIRVEGKGFPLHVNITPGYFRISQGPFEKNTVTQHFIPSKTMDYRLYIVPETYIPLPQGPLEYTLKVNRIPIAKTPVLKQASELTAKDPLTYENKKSFVKRDSHYKAIQVKLEAGRFYIIDMVRKGKGFDKDIDPYLYLEDPEGRVVTQDDDSGGDLNARIVYRPMKSGEYRIIATTLSRATGPFTLTVRRQLKEKE